jgi:erythromycin esterase
MSTDPIIAWLRANAIPLHHLQAGHGSDDLQPLKSLFADATIIGMGEATHGTREFVEVRHRLLEFLATEMRFNTLMIEASDSDMRAANEYVLHETGDPAKILSECGTLMWDTEEFLATLSWIRSYNRSVGDERKIRLYGMDIWPNRCARARVLQYLERTAPEKVGTTREMFESLAAQEAIWPAIAADRNNEGAIKELLPRLRELLAWLVENEQAMVHRSSASEFAQVQASLGHMEHWMMANITDFVPAEFPEEQGPKNLVRSRYMAENVRKRMESSPPGTRIVVWAHNYHLEIGLETAAISDIPNMGAYLKQWYGNRYYSLGLEFNRGAYLAREGLPEFRLGDFKTGLFESSREGSLPHQFATAGMGDFLLDLHAPASQGEVKAWLSSKQVVHSVSWFYKDPEKSYTEITVGKRRDGILFLNQVTATHPTAGALAAVAARLGL